MQVHQRPIRSPIGRQAAKAAAEAARKPIERVVDPAGCGNGRQSSSGLDREGQMTSKCERRAVQGGKTGGRGEGGRGREGGQRTIEQTCSTSQLEDGGGQRRRRESGRRRHVSLHRRAPCQSRPRCRPIREGERLFSVLPSHLTKVPRSTNYRQ